MRLDDVPEPVCRPGHVLAEILCVQPSIISTLAHLEHTVHLVTSGRVRVGPTITHVLDGIESVSQAFEITANKGKYGAINPAQVMMKRDG